MTDPPRVAFIKTMEIHQGNAMDKALAARLPKGKANLAEGAAVFAEAIIAAVRHVEESHGAEAADALANVMLTTMRGASVTTLLAAQSNVEG